MRPRRILFVALALAAVGVMAWGLLRGPKEPVYDGRPLSVWLADIDQPPTLPNVYNIFGPSHRPNPRHDQAVEALRHIGTNAMPFLLPMLRVRDSDVKLKLMAVTDRIPFLRGWSERASTKQLRAVRACRALRSAARPALPAMTNLLDNLLADQSTNSILAMEVIFAFDDIEPSHTRIVDW